MEQRNILKQRYSQYKGTPKYRHIQRFMTTQETIKPLVDRILSNPLQFKQASGKTEERNSSVIDTQKSSYIVIGNSNSISDKAKAGDTDTSGKAVSVREGHQMLKIIPKSMAEAINMYTTSMPGKPFANDHSDESLSDVDVNDVKNSVEEEEEEEDEEEEEFHEAKEYLERDEQEDGLSLPLGFDEDMGMPVEFDKASTGSSSSTDKDFKVGDIDSDSSNSDDLSNVSQNEKVQLQEEAQEAMAHANDDAIVRDDEGDELKHKIPLSQRSMTPPTIASDISNFYEFNENVNDTGSNASSQIVKNWGPHLSVLKPRGLLNHGVTCYTNAAVQAMVHIPAIQHYLFDILRCKYDETIAKDSVSYILAETSKKMWMPQDKSKKKKKAPYHINPKKLISRLDDINCMMSEWQQEDSHEYFMSLMSRLQEDSVPKGHKLTESIIYDIFGGLLKQEVTCKSCGSISKTEQPFYDLSLHLKGKKKLSHPQDSEDSNNKASNSNSVDVNALTKSASTDALSVENLKKEGQDQQAPARRFSIEKSIKDFFNPELIKVDKEQKGYVCEKCHKTTNAMKHNSILRAPETLLIHLKKFRFNGTSSSKMKQAVSYPMFLDLTEYCEPDENNYILPVKYQLTTVVVHEGRSLSSGHYIVHCKQPDGSWATYDDEYINKITERDVLKEPNAYYLLYTRLTPKEISFQDSSPINVDDLNIPFQKTSSSSSSSNTTLTPTSSPLLNGNNSNRNKKWKKNKKRRFDN